MKNRVTAEVTYNATYIRERIIIPGDQCQTYGEIVSMVRQWANEGRKPKIVMYHAVWDHVVDSFALYSTSMSYRQNVHAKTWLGRLGERLGLREVKKEWVTISAAPEVIDATKAKIKEKQALPIDGRWYSVRFRTIKEGD